MPNTMVSQFFAAHPLFWIPLVIGIASGLGVLAAVVGHLIAVASRALQESEPRIDDVTERRRMRAEAFAERRRQLNAAAGRRVS